MTRGTRPARRRVVPSVTHRALLTPFARTRFSPIRYDEAHQVSEAQRDALLDAARRAPSAGNAQPWSFIVGLRGDETHRRLMPYVRPSSSTWAAAASVLVVNLCQRFVEDSDLEYSEFAHYDLGQAVAHMTFQAHAMGLAVHQFRAFDRAALVAEFGVPVHWEITTMAAIGVAVGDAETHAGLGTSRERRSLRDVMFLPVDAS